jgi:hypothetical protein
MGAVPIREDLRPRSVRQECWQQAARIRPAGYLRTIEEVIEQQRVVAR